MRTFNIGCKVITPLFMGGAKQQAELRTQSINGLLRWWFRVLGGSIEDEKRIFGWAGETSNQGLVRIFIKDFDKLKTRNFEKVYDQSGFAVQNSGINYLGFSLDQRFKKDQDKPQREYIIENQVFEMFIRFHPKATNDDIKKFFCALWCAFNLGNFGSRSRRGFGSIMIEEIQGNFPSDFKLEFKPQNPIDKWLKNQLDYIKNLSFWQERNSIPYLFNNSEIYQIQKGNFSNWQSWVGKVQEGRQVKHLKKGTYPKNSWGGSSISSWQDLLNFMGFLLMAFRSYRNPDYDNAKKILQNQSNNQKQEKQDENNTTFERPIFGLPLNFYFSSLKNPKTRKRGYGDMVHLKRGNETLRRASPLMIKIIQSKNSYEGLFIVMKSTFMPNNSKLFFSGVNINLPSNEWKALDDFISSLENYDLNLIRSIYP